MAKLTKLNFKELYQKTDAISILQATKDIKTIANLTGVNLPDVKFDLGDFNSLLPLAYINAQKAYYLTKRKNTNLEDYKATRAEFLAKYRQAIDNGDSIQVGDKIYGPFGPKKEFSSIPNFTKDKIYLAIVNDSHSTETSDMIKSIMLPVVPIEFDYNPESNFVALQTSGRNNPRYCYAGSEDTLTFTVDWFLGKWQNITKSADVQTLVRAYEEVIEKARLLESFTKGDEYKHTPPIISIIWGGKKNLFFGDKWILTRANYKASGFNNGFIDKKTLINTNLYPTQITQNLEFKKVTKQNLNWLDIRFVDKGNNLKTVIGDISTETGVPAQFDESTTYGPLNL